MVGKQNTVPALTALKSRGGDSHEAGHSIVMGVIKVKRETSSTQKCGDHF